MFFLALIKGIVLGLTLSISVGPVIFSILKQSINNGVKGGITFIAGVSASDIALVLISNVFTELFRNLLDYKAPIAYGGSALLIGIGVYVLFFKKLSISEHGALATVDFSRGDYVKVFLSGFFMNTLNPSVIAFWLVISTTVVVEPLTYRLVMFTTCLLLVLGFDVAKVLLAGKIRRKLTPHNIHIINKISGLILIGFGVALVWGFMFYGDEIH
ncbi:MAG: LysE family transporter [Bacteroidota bacterium]